MTVNLIQYLNECSRHYYNGNPIISDEVFDRLAESVDYKNIGVKQHDNVQKHYYPMYSLQKYYKSRKTSSPLEGEDDISYSVKLDGAAISILYIDGELVRVLTRGDGKEGKNITDKFIESNLIPQKLHHTGIVQITGEVVAPKHIPNSRNYAAGSLNLKDINEFKTRAIEFIAYGVQPYQNKTFEEDMDLLKRIGFSTIKDNDLDKIYPSDGIVFRINSNKRFNELGYTSHHPRGAYALKEESETVEAEILSVEWNTSRTGKVTPVAILSPIILGDKQVSRATLNNPGFIEQLDIQIGDKVAVGMGGEIIPVIYHKIE